MKIGIDGGALSVDKKHQFGNYHFTVNLIKAIEKYDQTNNQYILYTFAQPNINFQFGKKIKLKIIKPKYFWSKIGLSLVQLIDKNDIFLAINQSIPFIKAKKIIGFSHGLSFYFFKELYPDSWRQLFAQHKIMMKRCHYVIVSSIKVKRELNQLFPGCDKKIRVLLYGIPFDIKMNKLIYQNKKSNYFLAVGMDHPIKNFNLLKKIFIQFKEKNSYYQYQLKIINSGVNHSDLSQFYKKAIALLTTSLYESFNLPVLEALYSGCPVVGFESAIIPEMKDFVFKAKNNVEFIQHLNKIAKQKITLDFRQLNLVFSWKKYIKDLIKLYD